MADEPPPFEEDQENEPEEELFDDPAPQDDPFRDVDDVKEEKSEELQQEPQPYEIPVPLASGRKEEEEEEEEATEVLPPAQKQVEEEEDKLSVESDEVKVKPPELVPSSREEPKVRKRNRPVQITEKRSAVNACMCVVVVGTAIGVLLAWHKRLLNHT